MCDREKFMYACIHPALQPHSQHHRYDSSPGDCFDDKTPSFPYVSSMVSITTVLFL